MTEWKVTSSAKGTKLIDFIKSKIDSKYSSRQIKRWIENNHCSVNGRIERFASAVVIDGDLIHFQLFEADSAANQKFHPDRDSILYEDNDLLIYNKPPGIACTDSLFLNALRQFSPGLTLIHRLDKDTSGALMLAKTDSMREAMIAEFKLKKIRKKYAALVDGSFDKESGNIESYLGKVAEYQGQSLWGRVGKGHGLYAQTQWKILQRGLHAALLECCPITGRTHQIRVHLAEIGHPILGDYQYGKKFKSSFRPRRYLLHASNLSFEHPLNRQIINVEAPIPEDFSLALQSIHKI
jgi:RluA family pseudouridine synthase